MDIVGHLSRDLGRKRQPGPKLRREQKQNRISVRFNRSKFSASSHPRTTGDDITDGACCFCLNTFTTHIVMIMKYHSPQHAAIKVLHRWLLIISCPAGPLCPSRDSVSCVQPDFIAHAAYTHKQSLYVLHLWLTWARWRSKLWRRSIIVTQVGSLITLLWTPEKSRAFI